MARRKGVGAPRSVSEGMGRGVRRGFARAMRVARQRIRGLGGEKSAPPRSKRGKGMASFAAILKRTRPR